MNQFVSIFRKVVGHKISVGFVAMALMVAVGGGSQLLLSTSAFAATAAGCSSYTVQPADTLSGIGEAHRTSLQALARANSIANVDLIYAGQKLCIPPTAGATSSARVNAQTPARQLLSAQIPAAGGSVQGMISQVFGPYASSAMAIASCESGFNPNATNPTPIVGSHAAGVFQILYPSTWSGTPYGGASPYDAWSNINAAHSIFVRDGYSWREWQCQA
jgi:LysM repeat protein